MKQKAVFYLILTGLLQFECTSNRQSSDSLPFIDVSKNYHEKEIVLTEIADVTYLHLSTLNDSFLYYGGINYATENTLVVADRFSNSILFFSEDGNPKSRLNRYGQGPEEYYQVYYPNMIYDEATDDLYVPSQDFIQVYSSTGKYKRKITLSHGINWLASIIVSFDDQSLLIYDIDKLWNKNIRRIAGDPLAFSLQMDSSFALISKIDGKVLEYVDIPSPALDLSMTSPISSNAVWIGYQRIVKCSDGFLLCNPENDTIYLYKKDKSLTPILRKIPLLSDGNIRVLENCVDAGKYQFMRVSRRRMDAKEESNETYYMRDKETGEVFLQKIVLPDYKGKEFLFYAYGGFTRYMENGYQFNLSLYELKQANRENRLSGALKELVDTLNEDKDNDIFMIVKFK